MLQDLSQYILDISENSLKADASRIDIELSENTQRKEMVLVVSDNGRGMDEGQLISVCDPFYTTRTERRVGLGIPFLKQAAEICGGELEIISGKGKGTRIRARFRSDCIDCPPRGDIPATLVTLLVGWPHSSFSFRYSVDEKDFFTDTDELAEILEDRNLFASPEVALWFGRFIKENLEILRTGREC